MPKVFKWLYRLESTPIQEVCYTHVSCPPKPNATYQGVYERSTIDPGTKCATCGKFLQRPVSQPRKPLYLYLLEQSVNNDYDTYDSCIVAAETEEEARHIRPYLSGDWNDDYPFTSWVKDPKDVTVKYIGKASKDIKKGVILASFNAG